MKFGDLRVDVPEGQQGTWRVSKFTVDDVKNDIQAWRCAREGRPIKPGTYTRLMHDGEWGPVMSDTPAEVSDHLLFLYQARGRILINGLGLGVVLKGLLIKPEVEHVDVVERESDVINLVWPTYAREPRLTLHQGDAYMMQWGKTIRWDYIWHDIWSSICTDNLEGITKLKRKYARRCGWQGAWVEDLLRRYKRQGR